MKKFLLSMFFMASVVSVSAMPYLINNITIERNGSEEMITFTYSDEYEWEEEGMTLVGGKLMKVTDGYSEFTLDYANLSSNILKMTRVDKDGETTLYEMTLNEEGQVVKAIEYNNGVLDEDYCTFEYTDGRLTSYKQISSEDVEESMISYNERGQISKVEVTDSSNETEVIDYEYKKEVTYTQVGYLWDMFYGVDLDDMEWVAVAGYLGDRINGIPTSITTSHNDVVESKYQDWDTDVYGFPMWITVSEDNETERYIIDWYSGPLVNVEPISAEKTETARFYNINGVEVSGDAKGIVIERKSDGSVVKHLNR